MAQFLNVSAYKFVPVADLEGLRTELKAAADAAELKGTILLSKEGINLFLAGEEPRLRTFLEQVRTHPEFADLETKDSYSAEQPFRRMLVRLKKEIIAFGVNGIAPGERTSPKLPARELKKWLDEGKRVRLLDVRNDYEYELGSFRGADLLDLDNFRNFPEAISQLPSEAKQEPLVMFCTGGIRCEKAGPLMEEAGFEEVYQLEGGILKYFEECGGAHYDGSCFVFDNRVALDHNLKPTGNLLCFACQAVLTEADTRDPRYVRGESCPHCYRSPESIKAQQFALRKKAILDLARSQPGSTEYENVRHIFVPRRCAGSKLIEFLTARNPRIRESKWREWIENQDIVHVSSNWQQRRPIKPETVIRDGDCFEQKLQATIEPDIATDVVLLHEDDDICVVNKPAPLPTHPSGRFNRNTLSWILGTVYENDKLRVAHRLDANTSGTVVLCRRQRAAKLLGHQFANQTVKKVYVARVHGHPEWETYSCDARIAKAPQHGGIRQVDPEGHTAQTQFRVLIRDADGTSLVEARPITGRTNQIRIHLWHMGHSIVGDPIYLPEHKTGAENAGTLLASAPPMCLHARSISFVHPTTEQAVSFEADLPEWASHQE